MKKKALYIALFITVFLSSFLNYSQVDATTYVPFGELYLDETTVPRGQIYVGQGGRIRPLQDSPFNNFNYAYTYKVIGGTGTGILIDEAGNWKALAPGRVQLQVWYGYPSQSFLDDMKTYDLNFKEDNLPTIVSYKPFDVEVLPAKSPVYRLYHSGLHVHLYTKDRNEYDVLAGRGWQQEGEKWTTDNLSGKAIYRLYHPDLRFHLYTMDTHEYTVLASRGWQQEGEAYKSSGENPVYRLYHEGIKKHLFTRDVNEKNILTTRGWRYEGVAWKVE